MTIEGVTDQPLFGIAITVLVYSCAQWLYARWRFLHPLFVTAGSLIALLLVTGIPYEDYRKGGDALVLLLGPATVALGVPLYKNAALIRRQLVAILGGLTTGSIAAMLASAALVWLLGGSQELLLTMVPKSVTTPIAIELTRRLGGIPELSAVLTTLTGLIGSMAGPELLRLCGVRSDVAVGVAVGTASHGIGTARLIRDSELQGGVSGMAMGLAGMFVSLALMPVYWWLGK
ncbi:LrgB family protein [Paenibacillus cymbidii]|uniref:LrgB family protein n=1 Tax=Paenibacillus cymbidii TaxID=1639034 RepID=UPI00108212B2|nr:LrgB family protein [Paenibacillus cymbidii]